MFESQLRRLLVGLMFPALLAACGGGDSGGPDTPARQPSAGVLQFSVGASSVNENNQTATLTLSRTQGSDGEVSVRVVHIDGSAQAGSDFGALGTTVTFAAGDATDKSVTIAIMDDQVGEADESFFATLANISGGAALGSIVNAEVTIADNDAPPLPQLQVDASHGQLDFSWNRVPVATHYRMRRGLEGSTDYSRFGPTLAENETSVSLAVVSHLTDWVRARYVLEACNEWGCSTSAPISALPAMIRAIAYVKASNTDSLDTFGEAVALSNDGSTLAVGAPKEAGGGGDDNDDSAPNAGAVYIYARAGLTGRSWQQQAYVKASNADAGDRFGQTLALSADGSTLIVGAPGEDSKSRQIDTDADNDDATSAGAAYVFRRGNGQWSQQAYLKASNAEAADFFGNTVTVSADGETIAVEARGEDSTARGVNGDQSLSGAESSGAVYVYLLQAAGWMQQAYVKATNPEANDAFGNALALSADGSTLAIGARLEDSNARGIDGDHSNNDASSSGAAYVYVRANDQWSYDAYIKASNTEQMPNSAFSADHFGAAIALSADGNLMAVGAPYESSAATGIDGDAENNGAIEAGAVYVFRRDAGTWQQHTYIKASNTQAVDHFGWAVAMNADGDMIAVGAPGEDSKAVGVSGDDTDGSSSAAGAAFVFVREADLWSQSAYVKASNSDISDEFGLSVALAANGGVLAVGNPGEDSGAVGVGGDQRDDTAVEAGAVNVY